MSLVAWKKPYLLQVMLDEEPENPREECDLFGRMVCWHRKYRLGDEHFFDSPNDFLKDLVLHTIPENIILDYVGSGKSHFVRLVSIGSHAPKKGLYETETVEEDGKPLHSGVRVECYDPYTKKWYAEDFFREEEKKELVGCLVDVLPNGDLLALAEKENAVLPLHLYDHCQLHLSASPFLGHAVHAEWDSGQVGWIYATAGEIQETYGNTSVKNMEKAKKLLLSEVETYDYYLSGQCYGFRLYEDGEEIQTGWGYFGSFSEIVKEIAAEFLPESHRDMVENLKEMPDTRTYTLGYGNFVEELEGMGLAEEMEV